MTDRIQRTFQDASASCGLRRFANDKAGTTVVEFAIIGLPALLLILAILEVGFSNFMQERMDSAVRQTGRLVLTGYAQSLQSGGKPLDATQFRDQVLCPKLPVIMKCSDVYVNITTIPSTAPSPFQGYVNSANSGLIPPKIDGTPNNYNIGAKQDYVVVQAAYPLPLLTSVFVTANPTIYKGKPTRLVQSFAAFKNEPF